MAQTLLQPVGAVAMSNTAPQPVTNPEVKSDHVLQLPLGLLGFEEHKRYLLLCKDEEAPFMWLQMVESPHQAFLVIPPAQANIDYQPELAPEDVEFLGLETPEDAWVLNIVTLQPSGEATVNLKGPVIVHRRSRKGKQVIPVNASDYAVRHPLGSG